MLGVLPTPAVAAMQTTAPPGNSAIDEYLETVPTPRGDAPPRKPGESGRPILTPSQRAELEAAGPDGETLARVLDATAPEASSAASAASSTASAAAAPAAGNGRSPVAASLAATTGTDERSALGLLLPAILLATLLGIALIRSRRART